MYENNRYYMDNMVKKIEYDDSRDILHLYFDTCIVEDVNLTDGMIVWHDTNNKRKWVHVIILDFKLFNIGIFDKFRISSEHLKKIRQIWGKLQIPVYNVSSDT